MSEHASEANRHLRAARVSWHPVEPLIDDAIEMATRLGGATQDAIYIALAKRLGLPLVTFDRRMAEIAKAASVDVSLL